MRHRLLRNIFGDIVKASRLAKIVLLIPFIVLLIDAEIFIYAWTHSEKTVLLFSGFVLLLSVLEIVVVVGEIHEHLSETRRRELIEERVRAIAEGMENPTVRAVIDAFLKEYPREFKMSEIYHVTCDLMCELQKE
jgi:hypothetical protein